jgi:hypothetical protein
MIKIKIKTKIQFYNKKKKFIKSKKKKKNRYKIINKSIKNIISKKKWKNSKHLEKQTNLQMKKFKTKMKKKKIFKKILPFYNNNKKFNKMKLIQMNIIIKVKILT